MKILIAEDDENSRVLLENVLTASGYEVLAAGNGLQALAILENQTPDLIISDILMPEMDGYTLCRNIRTDNRFSSIPLIFYTATYTDPKARQYAMDIGATAFLIKPMEMDLFLEEIKNTLKKINNDELPKSPSIKKDPCDLEQEYTNVLAQKLDKKIRDLELEREKLKLSEQKYKRIVESLRQEYFFYSLDKTGVLSYVSPSVEFILGYTPAEFAGSFDAFLSDHSVNTKAMEYKQSSLKGIKRAPFEMEFLHKDGSPRKIEVSEDPVFDAQGQVVSIEGIAQDITQKKKNENRIRQIHKMEALGTLAGGIAHDFNNILSSILGYANIIKDDINPNQRSCVYVSRIFEAGDRARSLISQILTYSRQTEQATEWVRIQDILKEAMKLLRPALPSSIEIDLNIAPDCQPIKADPTQIHQVVMNLITNANHAIKNRTGKISIRLSENPYTDEDKSLASYREQGHYLLLEIRDTGCGIARHDLDNIFDPYFTTKKKGEGTGLGLAIVHSIVSGLGGHISVETEPGAGTGFLLCFPCG
ncbi:MAG: response regulator [Proteobacteria bacterium]|nr:response regulator [Pseudomonadota bacterium]MBU1386692.1 response regulator [Pseudomonadota bacterium]MBU1543303.1 response regulator [Pseudomonadota bacterium]MBU2429947.1 response regulator [Pseudomonadota bacterium]MBU2483134.1 response regulator [Pseudomonadota bacterium]